MLAGHLEGATTRGFYGWRVVGAAFILAVCGWGAGFYGPPIFLQAISAAKHWSVALVSAAITLHFLIGAAVVANLAMFYRRFGIPTVTKSGAIALALGIFAWASASAPWQLFVATIFTGTGWATMGGAAVNAIVSPWFVRRRAAALGLAYNGASFGGVVFSPLWVGAIDLLGFPAAAAAIGAVIALATWIVADIWLSKTPQQLGLLPDGDRGSASSQFIEHPAKPLPGLLLWRDVRFLTLAAGMACGLFAQTGLLSHLFSLLVPVLGSQFAGLAMGGVTAAAIVGRTAVGWLMSPRCDRRLLACASYAVQIAGSAILLMAGTSVPLLLLGVILFGAGFGNATSLPPLIAQVEFRTEDVARVVPLIVAISQASYAFSPAIFGLIREFGPPSAAIDASHATSVFVATALVQGLAIGALLGGRK
jgi:hypothetical protein